MARFTPTASNAPEARFGTLSRVLSERRDVIGWIALLVIAATALAVFCLPTLYSTSAVVLLDKADPASIENQVQVLSSRVLAEKVIAQLGLQNDPDFNPALDQSLLPHFDTLYRLRTVLDGTPRDLTAIFLDRLEVRSRPPSTAIEVRFTAGDPQKTALIANTLVNRYSADQAAGKRQEMQGLLSRTHQLALQMQQQDEAVERYKAGHNLVAAPSRIVLDVELAQAQVDLADKKAAYDRLGTPIDNALSAKLLGELRNELAALLRQEADLATRYGPNHPKMEALRAAKQDLANKITAGEFAAARARVKTLEANLQRFKRQAQAEMKARQVLSGLEADLTATRATYESSVLRLRAIQGEGENFRVISAAPVPIEPSAPKRLLAIGISIPAGLLLGLVVAFLIDRPESRVEPAPPSLLTSPAQHSLVLPPLLGELPASADFRIADWVVGNAASPYGQSLAAMLKVLVPDHRARVVALTSPGPEPCKAVTALSLARLAACQGLRTILIDADSGRLAPIGASPGLSGLLKGAPLQSVLLRDRRSPSYLVSAAPELWTEPKLAELFRYLRQNSDLILVDAGPAGVSAAWPALARLSDSVAVLTAAKTPKRGFEAVLRSLVAMAAPLSGLIVAR